MARKVTITSQMPPSEDSTVHIVGVLPEYAESARTPIVFIHGLWLHASSWRRWVEYFANAGYDASAPGWPDFPDDIQEARKHAEFMVDQTIGEVADHYAHIIKSMPSKPVVVGHSFGGLIAQQLLDRG